NGGRSVTGSRCLVTTAYATTLPTTARHPTGAPQPKMAGTPPSPGESLTKVVSPDILVTPLTCCRMSDEQPAASVETEVAPACPETNNAFTLCVTENGETNCAALLEAHQECLKKLGLQGGVGAARGDGWRPLPVWPLFQSCLG
ncbi:Cytochrome c oxidase copper chaperone-like, partial [Homarus americanus]